MTTPESILRTAVLLGPQMLCSGAWAVSVQFSVEMAEPLAYGQFPEGAIVLLAGSFNAWQGSADPLADPELDGRWLRVRDLAAGTHAYKFVIQAPGGGLVWESAIGNRTVTVSTAPIELPLAWWNRTGPPDPPLQPVQVLFQVDPALQVAQGRFDPDTDALRILGAHGALGNWDLPAPALAPGEGGIWRAWVTFPALGAAPVAWKAVILPADGSPWIWEPGYDHELAFTDPDQDLHPAPGGDGIADLELPPAAFGHEPGWQPGELAWGADLSFTARLEQAGAVWSRHGTPQDVLELFRSRGWSVLRLRLWHSPAEPWHGLDSTLALARRGHELGYRLLLDLHYSDHWADPGQQTPPAAWQGLTLPVLADSVRQWTAAVMQRFHAEGLDPEWLQLGNEIDGGFLWPTGDVRGANDTPAQWQNLATLLGAAGEGAWQGLPVEARPRRVLHLAFSGDAQGALDYLQQMENRGVAWESTGLSYYPWWHGDLQALRSTLERLALQRPEDLLLVETDYPWTLAWGDNENNFVGLPEQLLEGFPATPEGQRAYYETLEALLRDVPGPGVSAACLWEPAWIPATGFGSVQENLALFDFSGNALPALDVPAPSAPALRIESGPPGHVRLTWPADGNSAHWRVEWSPGPGLPWQVAGETGLPEWELVAPPGIRLFRVVALDTPTP